VTEKAQIFLCYARPDFDQAIAVYARLESNGLLPWIDKKCLKPGDVWEKKIPAAIRSSAFVLVLLTKNSISKRGYLQKEIKEALDIQDEQLDQDRYVVPVRLEECDIPERLAHIQSADLYEPDGWTRLLDILSDTELDEKAPPTGAVAIAKQERPPISGVRTPCFFPSISSAAKNSLSPADHLKVLVQLKYPHFLISAFDVVRADSKDKLILSRLLRKAIAQGQIVLMDSGLYEKKWIRGSSWPRSAYYEALRGSPFHLAFGYDNPNPARSSTANANEIQKSISQARRISKAQTLVPIVHAKDPKSLPAICAKVVDGLKPPLVAIPERELGESVRACTQTIRAVRREIDKRHSDYVGIHVLGTGNPLSILVYSWAGADSFDGLDWCQTVVNYKTARLYHSLQLEFFSDQSVYASDPQISYMTRVLGHNLQFYTAWMSTIQGHMRANTLEEFLDKNIPPIFLDLLRRDANEASTK